MHLPWRSGSGSSAAGAARRWSPRLLAAYLLPLVVAAGCQDTGPAVAPPSSGSAKPFEEQALKVLVVGDRGLADAVRRLSGEWQAQTGAVLEVEEQGADQPLVNENLYADVLIYPSWQLATLAEEKLLLPVPSDLVEGEALAWADVFEQLRLGEASWGREVLAVPLGSARWMMYYRADILAKLERKPPTTWSEYHELAALLHDRQTWGGEPPSQDAPWWGASEPLAAGHGGLALMARAAAYVKHRDHYSALLNMETMEPLISGAPWVRALEEMTAIARMRPADQPLFTPAEVRSAFWRGQCGLAITWPSAAPSDNDLRAPPPGTDVGFAPLPGSSDVWNPLEQFWDVRKPEETGRVTLVAPYGRLGSVARKTRLATASFQLLLMLSTEPWCNQVSTYSGQTTLFRQSQLAQPRPWVEREVSAGAARQYAAVLREALAEPLTLDALRLPGRERYLAALDEAVRQAITGELTPRDALDRAAARWREVTEGYQSAVQRRSYQRSLGLGF